MNIFGVGTGELLLILLIALLVMGPERLPQLARQWAKIVRTAQRYTRTWHELNAEINRQLEIEDRRPPQPAQAPALSTAPLPADDDELANTIAPPDLASQVEPGAPPPPQPDEVEATQSDQATLT